MRRKKSPLRSNAKLILLIVFAFVVVQFLTLFVMRMNINAWKMSSQSMENTIRPGDYILANQRVYGLIVPGTETRLSKGRSPVFGEIVWFYHHDGSKKLPWVKRVIGVSGDILDLCNFHHVGVVSLEGMT